MPRLLQKAMGFVSVQVNGDCSAASLQSTRERQRIVSKRIAARDQQIDRTSWCVIQERQCIGPATAAGIGQSPISSQGFDIEAIVFRPRLHRTSARSSETAVEAANTS